MDFSSAKAEKYSPLLKLDTLDKVPEKLKTIRHVVVVAENDPNEFKRQTQVYAEVVIYILNFHSTRFH